MSHLHLNVRFALLPLVFAVANAADTAGGLPKESPFKLRGGPSAPVASANETIEFAGVSSIGKKTDLIFYDKTAKKSHWIAEGETKEGIAVIDYDERREEAVVKVNGVQKTLALRKAGSPGGAARPVANVPSGFNTPLPAALPAHVTLPSQASGTSGSSNVGSPTLDSGEPTAPPAPPAGSPAEIQQKQETEARMLVSDLLEIGMAQRRAYEEAQRKAAEGNSQTTPATETPQAGTMQPAQTPR
ncbi:MAG: hypothetical protein ACREH8_01855 [Opitutaceae bacterium]